MRFELFTKEDTRSPEKASEAILQYEKLQSAKSIIGEYLTRMGKISLLVAALAPSLKDAHAETAAGVRESKQLVTIENGHIELADGEAVDLPQLAGFENVKILAERAEPPKKLIVLFGQTHLIEEEKIVNLSEVARWNMLNDVIYSQRNIHNGLLKLNTLDLVHTVCLEGITSQENIETANNYFNNKKLLPPIVALNLKVFIPNSEVGKAAAQYETISSHATKISNEDLHHLDTIQTVFNTAIAEYKYIIGGAQLLETEGAVKLCAAELKLTNEAAFSDAVNKANSKLKSERTTEESQLLRNAIFEDREDMAIQKIAQEPDSVVGLTYGNAHDFSDALERWNTLHPENQFALAVYKGKEADITSRTEYVTAGFSETEIETISYAFKYKPWKTSTSSEEYTDGLQWLLDNSEHYKFNAEKIEAVAKIIGVM